VRVDWTGNTGAGTRDYRAYGREHEISAPGKPAIPGSSDPKFRGDARRYNPEELLLASLSSCHMLWYLHLASEAGIIVTAYRDDPVGTMHETPDGSGAFVEVVLRPVVTAQRGANTGVVAELHHRAHALCFIANSMNFPVRCEPSLEIDPDAQVHG
jgi:organic hydroperoxide reductase OsmC/OhrA